MEKHKSVGFKCFIIVFIFINIFAISFGLYYFYHFLNSYESSMPLPIVESVVDMFERRDCQSIRTKCGFTSTAFTNNEVFDHYLKMKLYNVKQIKIEKKSCNEEEAKCILTSDNKLLATVVLKREITPDKYGHRRWTLFELNDVYHFLDPYVISAPKEVKVFINGIQLTELEQKKEGFPVKGYDGLPDMYPVPKFVEYEVFGLLNEPKITASVDSKLPCIISENKNTSNYFSVIVEPSKEISLKIKDIVVEAMNQYEMFLTGDAKFADVSKCFVKGSTYYEKLRMKDNGFYISHNSHEFKDMMISDFTEYSPNYVSCKVSFLYTLYQDTKQFNFPSSYEVFLFYNKNDWYVVNMVEI